MTNRPERPDDRADKQKPVDEMTSDERREYTLNLGRRIRSELRELNRPMRERQLRQGRVKPRSAAEWDMFAASLLKDRLDDPDAGAASTDDAR